MEDAEWTGLIRNVTRRTPQQLFVPEITDGLERKMFLQQGAFTQTADNSDTFQRISSILAPFDSALNGLVNVFWVNHEASCRSAAN